jgi:prevent-host-death family protein
MATVSIAEAKDRLPSLVSAAALGEIITITRYGRPVAQIVAAAPPSFDPRSLDWIEAQLAGIPKPSTDSLAVLRALRDDE